MLRPRNALFLLSSMPEHPPAGGDTPKLSIGQQLAAALSTKNTLIKDRDDALSTVTELTQSIEAKNGELADALAKVTELEGKLSARDQEITDLKATHTQELATRDTEITQLQAEASSVRDQLAALGVPPKQLPPKVPAASTSKAEQLADIQAQIAASKDPLEKGRLAAKEWELAFGPN